MRRRFRNVILVGLILGGSADISMAQQKPIIYQLLPRLFGNKQQNNIPYGTLAQNGCGKFEDINYKALDGIRELGITHVWYTGVIAHASLTDYSVFGIPVDDADVVKGRAGSPYAIRDYYDVDPDLAVDVRSRMKEFEGLIARTHQKNLKVIIDFVPNHVARSYRSMAKPVNVKDFGQDDDRTRRFSPGNDYYYIPGQDFVVPAVDEAANALTELKDGRFEEAPAKATGNNIFSASPSKDDWYETVKLNYGVDYENGSKTWFDPIPGVWTKMRDILIYWADKGIDGFRCDVAEMVPVAFWQWVIPQVKAKHPGLIFIGEAYDPKAYRAYLTEGNFDYLYDKVGLYDGLKKLIRNEPSATVKDISKVWQVESAGFGDRMLRFLENHDEERIASAGFAGNPHYALPAMVVSATLSGGPVMLYSGQEVAEPAKGAEGFGGDDNRTTIFDYWGVPEHQKWMNNGAFDGGALQPEQRELRHYYQRLMQLAGNSEAILKGDILEVPLNNDRVYAFIRHTGNQRLLIVANFQREGVFQQDVTLPEASLKTDIRQDCKDLLTDTVVQHSKNTLSLNLLPGTARIIEF